MSLWVDSLTLAGLTCLTVGTGAQALASSADFRAIAGRYAPVVPEDADKFTHALMLPVMWSYMSDHDDLRRRIGRALTAYFVVTSSLYSIWAVARWHRLARKMKAEGGNDLVDTFPLLRQSAVWTILCIGSALVWAGAFITLVHEATG